MIALSDARIAWLHEEALQMPDPELARTCMAARNGSAAARQKVAEWFERLSAEIAAINAETNRRLTP